MFSYSVLIYTPFPPLMGCILSGILFGLTRIPIPSSSWVTIVELDCGIFPRSRGTLRPNCHILTYQSTEVKHAEYMVSVSIPAPASLQCGPPSARDVGHPATVTLVHLMARFHRAVRYGTVQSHIRLAQYPNLIGVIQHLTRLVD